MAAHIRVEGLREAYRIPERTAGCGARCGASCIGGTAPWRRYPLLRVLGRTDPLGAPAWLGMVSPLAGFAFFGLAALLCKSASGATPRRGADAAVATIAMAVPQKRRRMRAGRSGRRPTHDCAPTPAGQATAARRKGAT